MRRHHLAARRRPLFAALLYSAAAGVAIGVGAAALLPAAVAQAGTISEDGRAEIRAMAETALPNLVVHDEARGPWTTGFKNGEGAAASLADFEGDVVVLNLWATWCPPCVHEMPSLDRLSATLQGSGARVVTLSTDRGGAARVRAFFEDTGNEEHPRIEHLDIYVDQKNKLPREAAVLGLPVTIILDREGGEIARLTGDAEWDAPGIVTMVKRIAEMTESPLKEARAPAQ